MIVENKNIALKIANDYLLLTAKTVNNFGHSIYVPPDSLPIRITLKSLNRRLARHGSIKRIPTPWSDYIEITPNSYCTRNYSLNEIFAFHGGYHDYTLRFYNGYFYPDEKTYHELGFVELEFSWSSPIDYANLRVD